MKRRSELLIGGLLVVFGVLWLLDAADVVDTWRWGVVGPLLLLVVGLWRVATSFGGVDSDTVLGSVDSFIALSDRHLRCEGPFEGGSIVVVLADVELDLTSATLSAPSAELSTTTILGELDILVPAHWRVRTEGPAVLADVDVRPRGPASTEGAEQQLVDRPELVIRSFGLLSDLTVRSGRPS